MLRSIIRKIIYREKADSDSYIRYLRSIGMRIGDYCQFFTPTKMVIDETRPWLISIGNNVQITIGVTILTHGYDWSVLKGVYGEILGSSGGVSIGNNVFIGMHSTILKGTHIGNNVIIGANSLVNKDIPDNVVVAGNPCRIIMTVEEYYEKRKAAQLKEATELVRLYRERYGKEPDDKVLDEFFWLFENNPDTMPEIWKQKNKLGGNELVCNEVMRNRMIAFRGMDDFLNSIK